MATTISNGESGSSVRTKLNNIWEGLQINEIDSSIADTAVDIFVYDTRKDSDGGAWRKRTQHTSWYNETLNTSTRGSRKEFPAVAVIVAESNQVTIYDGDDPDLPMWMSFTSGTTNIFIDGGGATGRVVFAKNGKVVFGMSYDLHPIDFITDSKQIINAVGYADYRGTIAQRNDSADHTYYTDSSRAILSRAVNDVAMTVLPNAPIDAATGLPVPTIAVATDGGVSVIKDDGTVVDLDGLIESNNNSGHVELDADGNVWFTSRQNSAGFFNGIQYFGNVSGTTDASVADDIFVDISRSSYASAPYFKERNTQMLSNAWAGNYGLTKVAQDYTNRDATMLAEVTSDYNTGWMNGDIKLATLSDTDDTDVTGSELVTNGTFDSDLTGWTAATAVWSSGAAAVGGSGGNGYIYQNMGLVTGQTYVVTFDVTATTSPSLLVIQNSTSGSTSGGIYSDNNPPVGSYSVTFTASNSELSFVVGGGDSAIVTLDNISVRIAEEDRSVNGNGLQVFGTVTKDPVATGADLVAYSGFSGSNYLEQPYNSDLDFGTGDFCVMGWYNTANSTTTEILFSRVDSGNVAAINCMITSSETLILQVRESSTSSTVTTTETASTGVWNCFAFVRRNSGTVQEVYINGKLSESATVTARNMSSSTGKTYLGYTPELASNAKGSMALWRISATAPSPEQIARIYNDEKHLFTEGAQATLYGSSDSVTALAYDTDSELLHVGTSAGRSVFQGLRRVDNTTTAVTSAISASNGLVADE